MGSTNKPPLFFRSKPLFGLDIGMGTLKVVQIDTAEDVERPKLISYGFAPFDPKAIENGVIIDPEKIAVAARQLFEKDLIGDITTRRVAIALPAYRTFTRSIQLPPLKAKERAEAVELEAEQYLPMPLEDMYIDFTPVSENAEGLEVLAVAVPKNIVASYLELSALMGVEPVLIETTMNAAGRVMQRDKQSDVSTVIIDFGTLSSDISIYDKGIVTTGTVEGGGQVFNNSIQKALNVSGAEAAVIKTKYGLGVSKRQHEIQAALDPTLGKILKEIKRLIRYHAERYGTDRPIKQVVTLGGGANMPGLNEYFTSELRLAARACDPWQYVNMDGLQPPNISDRSMYATAIGLAFAPPDEVFS